MFLLLISSITMELAEAITSDTSFVTHKLTTLMSKAIQAEVLRTIRSQASKKYKELKKQQA